MNIYKVYDDEWEGIMGSGQLKEFSYYQTQQFLDTHDEEWERECTEDLSNLSKNALEDIKTGLSEGSFVENVSDGIAIELLALRSFDVEELKVY